MYENAEDESRSRWHVHDNTPVGYNSQRDNNAIAIDRSIYKLAQTLFTTKSLGIWW